MITQKQNSSIHRRQQAISVFLVLDDASHGKNFALHKQIYEALERGDSLTACVSKSPTFNTEGMAQ